MDPLGFLQLFSFFTLWVGSTIIIPAAFLLFYFFSIYWPIYILIIYYSIRYFIPRRYYPSFHEFVVTFVDHHPYFKERRIVLPQGWKEWKKKLITAAVDNKKTTEKNNNAVEPAGSLTTAANQEALTKKYTDMCEVGMCKGDNYYHDNHKKSSPDARLPCVCLSAPSRSSLMFAFHPHGILSAGWSVNGCGSLFFLPTNIKWLAAESLFKLPFISDYLTAVSAQPASPSAMKLLMSNGENVALLPGGFEEATVYEENKYRAFIKHRAGFIKYALQFGYSLIPVFSFGEELTYTAFTPFLSFRLSLNKYKIPAVLAYGMKYFPHMPRPDIRMITVIGDAILLPKIEKPTKEQVNQWHQIYINGLVKLFDQHKEKYATKDAVLELF